MVSALAVRDTETVPDKLLELSGFPLPKASVAGRLEDLGQLPGLRSGQLLRRGILTQNGEGSFPEDRTELAFKLGEYLIQKSGDLPFEIAAHIDEVKAVPAELPQRQQLLLRHAAGLVPAKADGLHNDQGVDLVRLIFLHQHFPHGIRLDGIEYHHLVSLFPQTGVEGQPVVGRGFHGEEKFALVVC